MLLIRNPNIDCRFKTYESELINKMVFITIKAKLANIFSKIRCVSPTTSRMLANKTTRVSDLLIKTTDLFGLFINNSRGNPL